MEAEIHKAFGDIFDRDALVLAQIENAFVSDEAGMAAVKDGEIILEAIGDVVGVEDCVFRRFGEAHTAHRGNVNPRDCQNAGAAPWRGGNCADRIFAAKVYNRVAGKKIDEMFGHTNRSHTWAATTVRDAERFVEVQMANVRAHVGGPAKADLRVEVCAVHINLAAVGVDDLADFFDGFFEYAVS